MSTIRFLLLSCVALLVTNFSFSTTASAASATEINIGVTETLKRFKTDIPGGEQFLKKANAVLVFPSVIKVGFGIGGEYGEGALQIGGKTVAYYSTAAASIGLQMGAQSKSLVVVFMNNEALKHFQSSKGWKAGVDGSVAVIEWGVGEDINTIDIEDPIIGFVFSNKGLMFNLTLEGSKFTKIEK
ncbi:MAG: YSC84-related protein [Gammaproteobacteria bacterium]|nr:YSC84-related protein [Gammaproteobacteria bacterium]MDH5592089.1 YSC84-related protein [Gammaproteobacteria bacterium]